MKDIIVVVEIVVISEVFFAITNQFVEFRIAARFVVVAVGIVRVGYQVSLKKDDHKPFNIGTFEFLNTDCSLNMSS